MLDSFRSEARAWLELACPPAMRKPIATPDEEVRGGKRGTFPSDDARVWLQRMAERGWTAPTWPREYGGGGLSSGEALVLEEEMKALGCRPPLKSVGLWMLGPLLLEHGTAEQKRLHLPPIVRGEIRWCQGFSEPGAGSDLASLQARAVRDGDDWVVDGQKVWISQAEKADWIFCLVRTDATARKHEGISFLLVDMTSPGVETRPITLISGASHFSEVYLESVRVPGGNLVGAPGAGWGLAKRLLEFEREGMSRMREAETRVDEPLEAIARQYLGAEEDGTLADPLVRDEITRANIDSLCNKLVLRRVREESAAGRTPGPGISVLKICGAAADQRRRALLVTLAGFRGLGWAGAPFTPGELGRTREWLRSRASSLEGGSSEIQLNIIARRVLGLPE